MPTSTRTGQQVLDALSKLIEDYETGTTTSAGASDGTSLTDTAIANKYGTDALRGQWVRITSGTADNEEVRISGNNGSAISLGGVGFSAQIASGVTYEIHKYEPEIKWRALDRAVIDGYPAVSQVVVDETLFGDDHRTEFDLPSTMRTGPFFVWEETEIEITPSWSFLNTPRHDALNSDWVLAGAGAARALVTEGDSDRLIPKYDASCTKISVPNTTVTTYTQSIGSMKTITAASVAGRAMEAGIWVYSDVASRVTLVITDDSASATSSTHAGRGWEFLSASLTVDGDNATTLDVQISVSSGDPLTLFVNRGWLAFGFLPNIYHQHLPRPRVRRDASVQEMILDRAPRSGINLRIEGRGPLTAINSVDTATIELDDESEELFAAFAARALFRSIGIATDSIPSVSQKVAAAEEMLEEMDENFDADMSEEVRVKGPWW